METNKDYVEEPFYKYHYGKWIKVGVLKTKKSENGRKRVLRTTK